MFCKFKQRCTSPTPLLFPSITFIDDFHLTITFNSSMINRVRVLMFNATFNNISVVSWRRVVLVEETGGPRENHIYHRSYDSWMYNYLCNQCLSPLILRVLLPLRRYVLGTTLCDKVCQWLVAGRWFSPCTPVFSSNKIDCHDITEILLQVALNT
jgi:hypothetical protein